MQKAEIVMHIDTSSKLYERKDTSIAYKIVNDGMHKGLGLRLRLKKELERDLEVQYDYPRLYAICIYYLIKDDLDCFDTLVICGDENFHYVKMYLDLLFSDNDNFFTKRIMSISQLRELTGEKKLKSKADNVARAYRRRVLKCLQRQQRGRPLNPVHVNYSRIKAKWLDIDAKLKES